MKNVNENLIMWSCKGSISNELTLAVKSSEEPVLFDIDFDTPFYRVYYWFRNSSDELEIAEDFEFAPTGFRVSLPKKLSGDDIFTMRFEFDGMVGEVVKIVRWKNDISTIVPLGILEKN